MTTSKQQVSQQIPTIGILGDGQLSMMMAQAYQALGGKVFVFAASDNGPASEVADQLFVGDTDSVSDLETFFNAVDIVTLENEFLDSRVLSRVAANCATPLRPNPDRFGLIEDKLAEKRFFQDLGVSVAEFFEVKQEQDLLDVPGYLKLAKGGYDGIGTYRVNNKEQAVEVFNTIKSAGTVLFEKAIDYQKELSLIAVRGLNNLLFYPMVETYQENGTCRYVSYPSNIDAAIEEEAKTQVERIMEKLDTQGVFAFEFFLTKDDQLILNESAPRPHNSGHITLDLADCSQFENHMRAVAGLDIKVPKMLKDSMLMVNLLGTQNGEFDAQSVMANAAGDEASVTLYRKHQSRIKRKMGHINLWGEATMERAKELVRSLEV